MVKHFILLLTLLLLLSQNSFALQILPIQEDVSILLPISRSEITRITVEHDRIQQLIGPKGAYHLQQGEIQGDIYLEPKVAHPFTVLIETEQGRHLSLLVHPTRMPPSSIRLQVQGASHVNR